ncbi:MAG: aldo/keto reductase [Gammaproteobacteria bacterium]|nr:aldo/keto reductase [Gammaproteobacteria bacterium]
MKRRDFVKSSAAVAGVTAMASKGLLASTDKSSEILLNKIPSSGESIPVIGMGTYRNLNIQDDSKLPQRVELIKQFFELGGQMLDSSPMYGQSEKVIGYCLEMLGQPKQLFATTKVWTKGEQDGIEQMQDSMRLWGLDKFDLMQIHNLVDWQTHLKTLRKWKEKGLIKYIGITTSHGRDHAELAAIMQKEPLDFVQLTYNIRDREVENKLLPLAADKGIAVIVNRPFNGLFGYTKGKALPAYAKEIGCNTWAQFYLKFVISHPAVTCAIPATSKIKHLKDNMLAGYGALPDAKMRQEMIGLFSQYL